MMIKWLCKYIIGVLANGCDRFFRSAHESDAEGARLAICIFCSIFLIFAASCGQGTDSAESKRPNIILISIDTLRADHIHGYGYPLETSPTLDSLMNRGTSFLNTISAAPWTLPAHVSLFTSLYPHSHGVTWEMLALEEAVQTLPMALKKAGYETIGLATMPHLSPRHGFGRGFDFYFCQEVPAPIVLGEALKRLNDVQSENFFLFLHLFDVHTDYSPLPQYLEIFESSYDGGIDGTGKTLYKIRDRELALSPEDLRHLIALYDAEIRQLDSALELFFNALEKRGLVDESVVIVTADHGEEFLDHGGVLHGRTLYDELIKVPLIIAGPGIPKGKAIQKQAELIDIMPTILDIGGARKSYRMEGRSLLPLIEDEGNEWEEIAFAEADWRNEKHDIKRAVRTEKYKLYYDRHTKREELYDLALDPGERNNIIESNPEAAEPLRKRLFEWMATERGNPGKIFLTEEEKEQLRALGYMN